MRTEQKLKSHSLKHLGLAASILIIFFFVICSTAAAATPKITSLDPNQGPEVGGNVIKIKGTGFTGVTKVNFGNSPVTVSSPSDTVIDVKAPPGKGKVNVTVSIPPHMEPYNYPNSDIKGILIPGKTSNKIVYSYFQTYEIDTSATNKFLSKMMTIKEILDAHNKSRKAVNVPPLKWDSNLADSAQKWADHLSAIDKLEHSGPGENLRWSTADESWTTTINRWADEQKCFKNEAFPDIYNGQCNSICAAKDWSCAGHYSQIIWKNTQKVGCGKSYKSKSGKYYYVCQYSPPGNSYGQKAY